MKTDENALEFDSIGDYFYVILDGAVGIHIPNPEIKLWRTRYEFFKKLKDWENQEYFPKERDFKKKFLEENPQFNGQECDKFIQNSINNEMFALKLDLDAFDIIKNFKRTIRYEHIITGPLQELDIKKCLNIVKSDIIKMIKL